MVQSQMRYGSLGRRTLPSASRGDLHVPCFHTSARVKRPLSCLEPSSLNSLMQMSRGVHTPEHRKHFPLFQKTFPSQMSLYPPKLLMTFFRLLLLISNFYFPTVNFAFYVSPIFAKYFAFLPIFPVKPNERCRCIFLQQIFFSHGMNASANVATGSFEQTPRPVLKRS